MWTIQLSRDQVPIETPIWVTPPCVFKHGNHWFLSFGRRHPHELSFHFSLLWWYQSLFCCTVRMVHLVAKLDSRGRCASTAAGTSWTATMEGQTVCHVGIEDCGRPACYVDRWFEISMRSWNFEACCWGTDILVVLTRAMRLTVMWGTDV